MPVLLNSVHMGYGFIIGLWVWCWRADCRPRHNIMSHIPPFLWESWSYHRRWKLGQLTHKYLPHVLTLYLLPFLKDLLQKKKNLYSSGLYSTCFVSNDVEHVLIYCPHFWTARNLFHSHLQALGFDFSFRFILSDNSEKYLLSFICSSKLFIWYVLVYFVL